MTSHIILNYLTVRQSYLILCGALCFFGRRALFEEGGYGALAAGRSRPGLQVSEANVYEREVEGCVAVHHLVEELHGHADQLDHGITAA